MARLLETHSLSFQFESRRVLKDLSFHIEQGEFLSVLGPSGCGKSVLIRLLLGLLPDQTGAIRWVGGTRPPASVSFQKAGLIPWLSLLENLTLCMSRPFALEQLKRVGLESFSSYRPSAVSGGMAQKANVLRCFGTPSDILFLDEPFSELDYIQRGRLQEFTLAEQSSHGKKTVFLVTHDIDEAIFMSDRILVLSSAPGTVVDEIVVPFGRPRDLEAVRQDPAYGELFKRARKALAMGGHE